MASPSRWTGKFTRNATFRVMGSLGFLHELVLQEAERPTILLVCATLMGLPSFLNRDEQRDRDGAS